MDIYGQFRSRPEYVAGFINKLLAASVIYPAVLAAWTYLALVHTGPELDPVRAIVVTEIAIVVFIIGFSVLFYLNHYHAKYDRCVKRILPGTNKPALLP